METLQERMEKIVQTSYDLLCKKIVGGIYTIENEASLQLLFGEVLLDVGRLHTYSRDEYFTVGREYKYSKVPTSKNNIDTFCDISLKLKSGNEECSAAIEMKYLKKSKNEATTDNRFSVLQDIENLEHYPTSIGFMLVYTDNPNYTNPKTQSYLKIGHNNTIGDGTVYQTGNKHQKDVLIKGNYTFHWNTIKNGKKDHCFMLLRVTSNI